MIDQFIDCVETSDETVSTFLKFSKDFESFKKTTNFRIQLFQSKEYKQIDQFFTKFLSS